MARINTDRLRAALSIAVRNVISAAILIGVLNWDAEQAAAVSISINAVLDVVFVAIPATPAS